MRRPDDRQVGFTLALFLVSLGLRADLAAAISEDIDRGAEADPARASRLHDLELALYLENDGDDFAPRPPDPP